MSRPENPNQYSQEWGNIIGPCFDRAEIEFKRDIRNQTIDAIEKRIDYYQNNIFEDDIFKQLEAYKIIKDKNFIDPIDFANFFDLNVFCADLTNHKIQGFLGIDFDNKNRIVIEEKQSIEKMRYITAYESAFYLLLPDKLKKSGVIYDYIDDDNLKNHCSIRNVCDKFAREMLIPKQLLIKEIFCHAEYYQSNRIQKLADCFKVEPVHIQERLKELNLR